jgi:hypothetical protein
MMFNLEHIELCPGNPMSLFDFYIMIDWSGAMRRRGMRADTIWTAYGGIEAENRKTDSPFSRTEAIHLVHSLLDEQSGKMLRVLLCFDFAFGFPRDFSAALQTATGKTDAVTGPVGGGSRRHRQHQVKAAPAEWFEHQHCKPCKAHLREFCEQQFLSLWIKWFAVRPLGRGSM